MDMIFLAITRWATPCPQALTPNSIHDFNTNETIYVIGYNDVPTAENILQFQQYHMSVDNQYISIEEARQLLKSHYRMVSLGNIKSIDNEQKCFLISASLFFGSSGSPIFSLCGGSLHNIGYGTFSVPTHPSFESIEY
jgi:hypothetical protein